MANCIMMYIMSLYAAKFVAMSTQLAAAATGTQLVLVSCDDCCSVCIGWVASVNHDSESDVHHSL